MLCPVYALTHSSSYYHPHHLLIVSPIVSLPSSFRCNLCILSLMNSASICLLYALVAASSPSIALSSTALSIGDRFSSRFSYSFRAGSATPSQMVEVCSHEGVDRLSRS